MADDRLVTHNLLEMYGRNDWMMRLNFWFFLRLSGLIESPRCARIVDCGCGMGHLILMLHSYGFTRVSGLDASPEMVQSAKKLTGAPIIHSDILEIEKHFEPESIDVLIVSDLFHHLSSIDQWKKVLRAGGRVLKNEGILVIREPYPTIGLRLLYGMSHYRFFHVGFLRARLRSFVQEDKLLKYFFAYWPQNYKGLLTANGYQIIKDLNWLVHRITSCQKRRGDE